MGTERAAGVTGGVSKREPRARAPQAESLDATRPRGSLKAVVFSNPVAPNADQERLREALDRHFGSDSHRIVATRRGAAFSARMDRELNDALEAGCDLVVAAGGDGTVSRVAESLHRMNGDGSHAVLAIVPCGTANVLARELGIPVGIEDSVALAASRPRVVPLDALARGDRLFLTQVGIGLDAYMIHDTTRRAQQRFKRLSYLTALARRLAGHRSQAYRIRVDGQPLRARAWQVLLANASTLGARPFKWGPDIDPTDGIADLCIYEVRRLRDFAGLLWRVLTGSHEASPHARFVRVKHEVTIESRHPLPVQGDGEALGPTPVRLEVVPQAVRVAVPAPEASERVEGKAGAQSARKPRRSARHRLGAWWSGARRRFGATDTAVYLAINRLEGGPLVDRLMRASSRLLDWGELWVLVALGAAVYDRARFGWMPLFVIPVLWASMLTVNYPIKLMFRRRRPFLVHDRARLRGRSPKDTSFPSGHTAAAFAGAALIGPQLGALGPLAWIFASAVGFSRVYLGMHFLADVLVGAVVGTLLAAGFGSLWGLIVPGP